MPLPARWKVDKKTDSTSETRDEAGRYLGNLVEVVQSIRLGGEFSTGVRETHYLDATVAAGKARSFNFVDGSKCCWYGKLHAIIEWGFESKMIIEQKSSRMCCRDLYRSSEFARHSKLLQAHMLFRRSDVVLSEIYDTLTGVRKILSSKTHISSAYYRTSDAVALSTSIITNTLHNIWGLEGVGCSL
jgi:hypothetical protein